MLEVCEPSSGSRIEKEGQGAKFLVIFSNELLISTRAEREHFKIK